MPLDPSVKAFLDQMGAIPGPKLWQMPVSAARHTFAALMQFAGPRDVPVGGIENFIIPGSAGPIAARAYTPVAAPGGVLPALVYLHGGGYVLGSLESHDGLCRLLAQEGGFRVIAVDYRLAPEHQYPAALEDGYGCVKWIGENASQLGIDAGRIAVGGDSAGAHMAAVICQMAKEKGGLKLAYQLLLFPMTQIGRETSSLKEFAVGYFLEKQALEWFYHCYVPPGADIASPLLSPLRAKNFAGLPGAYVMLGGYDPLHDEGLQYAEKLRAGGARVTIADYPEMVHCFIYLQTVLPQAREAIAAAAKAVREALDAS